MSDKEICPECNKEKDDVKKQIDGGLSVGIMCRDCFIKLISDCRKRSW